MDNIETYSSVTDDIPTSTTPSTSQTWAGIREAPFGLTLEKLEATAFNSVKACVYAPELNIHDSSQCVVHGYGRPGIALFRVPEEDRGHGEGTLKVCVSHACGWKPGVHVLRCGHEVYQESVLDNCFKDSCMNPWKPIEGELRPPLGCPFCGVPYNREQEILMKVAEFEYLKSRYAGTPSDLRPKLLRAMRRCEQKYWTDNYHAYDAEIQNHLDSIISGLPTSFGVGGYFRLQEICVKRIADAKEQFQRQHQDAASSISDLDQEELDQREADMPNDHEDIESDNQGEAGPISNYQQPAWQWANTEDRELGDHGAYVWPTVVREFRGELAQGDTRFRREFQSVFAPGTSRTDQLFAFRRLLTDWFLLPFYNNRRDDLDEDDDSEDGDFIEEDMDIDEVFAMPDFDDLWYLIDMVQEYLALRSPFFSHRITEADLEEMDTEEVDQLMADLSAVGFHGRGKSSVLLAKCSRADKNEFKKIGGLARFFHTREGQDTSREAAKDCGAVEMLVLAERSLGRTLRDWTDEDVDTFLTEFLRPKMLLRLEIGREEPLWVNHGAEMLDGRTLQPVPENADEGLVALARNLVDSTTLWEQWFTLDRPADSDVEMT